jgi:class 3 adenylate cyclase
MAPETRYAKSGDVHIAYQVSGEGPLDLVLVPGFVSNVELAAEMPFGSSLEQFEKVTRLIHFDKRGTGLSDRAQGVPSLEMRMDDVRAVMDAVGSERAALWGISEGGPMCILFAATYPDRTSSLVLQGSFARITQAPDQDFGYPVTAVDAIATSFEEQWGTGAVMAQFFPSLRDDPNWRQAFARYERNGASPSAVAAIIAMVAAIDVRPILPTIRVPALVVHSAGDPIIDVRHGRYLASHIPGAQYVETPGEDHLTVRGDESGALDDVEEFLTGHRPAPSLDRILTSVLFTDIVDSTARATALGDHRWRALLDQHDAALRSEIERFRGSEVKTTGDGFLATFDGPARAVHCALASTAAAQKMGIEVRSGVHTGECVRRGEDIGGIGVHIAARIASLARPSQVLVSRTVTDLVAGSGLQFEERGEHDLKGVSGSWTLYEAVSSSQ